MSHSKIIEDMTCHGDSDHRVRPPIGQSHCLSSWFHCLSLCLPCLSLCFHAFQCLRDRDLNLKSTFTPRGHSPHSANPWRRQRLCVLTPIQWIQSSCCGYLPSCAGQNGDGPRSSRAVATAPAGSNTLHSGWQSARTCRQRPHGGRIPRPPSPTATIEASGVPGPAAAASTPSTTNSAHGPAQLWTTLS